MLLRELDEHNTSIVVFQSDLRSRKIVLSAHDISDLSKWLSKTMIKVTYVVFVVFPIFDALWTQSHDRR